MAEVEIAKPRGMYFEDFVVGEKLVTPRRTVTLTDIVNFACLSGDYNAPHINVEFCKTQPYGEQIAHGPLILAISGGLTTLSGINDGTIVAMLGGDKWRILVPVKHGDTIHVVATPISKRLASDGKRGIVTFERLIKNQRGEVVQSLETTNLYLCRPGDA